MDSDTKYEFNTIKDKLNDQSLQLDTYNKSLHEHMERTALLEAGLLAQKEYFDFRHDSIEKIIEKQQTTFDSLPSKILQYISILAGLIALIKLLF